MIKIVYKSKLMFNIYFSIKKTGGQTKAELKHLGIINFKVNFPN